MKILISNLSLFVIILFSRNQLAITFEDVENKSLGNDVISQAITFCSDKVKENFCNPSYLKVLINSAALQGKVRPIEDLNELESEIKKEMEKKRFLKLEQERKIQEQLKLKIEHEKLRESYLTKIKDQERMKPSEYKKYLLGNPLEDYEQNDQLNFEHDY